MNRRLRIVAVLVACLVAFTITTPSAYAGDKEFDAITHHIRTRLNGRKKGIPFFGLARFAVRLIRPAGLKSIKLEIFEDISISESNGGTELAEVMSRSLGDDWQPLIRVYSRRDREQTLVYAKADGEDIRLMAVGIEGDDAFVVKARISPESLSKFMENPKILGIRLGN